MVASDLAISLAQAKDEDIVAQTVIDSDSVMSLTGYRGYAGLCGSGVFLGAYHEIVNALTSVCDSLLMSFTARAEGRGLRVKSFIDTGDVESVLRARIAEHDGVLVLPCNDSEQSLMTSFDFGCPTIVVTVPQDNSTEIDIVANDETGLLQTAISLALPEAPIHLTKAFRAVA
jgi:hypothetical protein